MLQGLTAVTLVVTLLHHCCCRQIINVRLYVICPFGTAGNFKQTNTVEIIHAACMHAH